MDVFWGLAIPFLGTTLGSAMVFFMKNKIPHSSSPSNQEIMDSYDFLANSASTQDCTGLIPSGPVNEDELTSYETVYHYLPPQIKNSKKEPEDRKHL